MAILISIIYGFLTIEIIVYNDSVISGGNKNRRLVYSLLSLFKINFHLKFNSNVSK